MLLTLKLFFGEKGNLTVGQLMQRGTNRQEKRVGRKGGELCIQRSLQISDFLFFFLFLSTLHSFISSSDLPVIDRTIQCCQGASRHLVLLLCVQAALSITALVRSRVNSDVVQIALRSDILTQGDPKGCIPEACQRPQRRGLKSVVKSTVSITPIICPLRSQKLCNLIFEIHLIFHLLSKRQGVFDKWVM